MKAPGCSLGVGVSKAQTSSSRMALSPKGRSASSPHGVLSPAQEWPSLDLGSLGFAALGGALELIPSPNASVFSVLPLSSSLCLEGSPSAPLLVKSGLLFKLQLNCQPLECPFSVAGLPVDPPNTLHSSIKAMVIFHVCDCQHH